MLKFKELIEILKNKEPVIYRDPYQGESRYDYIDEIKIVKNKFESKMTLKAHMVKKMPLESGIEREVCCEGYAKHIYRDEEKESESVYVENEEKDKK